MQVKSSSYRSMQVKSSCYRNERSNQNRERLINELVLSGKKPHLRKAIAYDTLIAWEDNAWLLQFLFKGEMQRAWFIKGVCTINRKKKTIEAPMWFLTMIANEITRTSCGMVLARASKLFH